MQGNLFKTFNTNFSERTHTNFNVWSYKTKLWDNSERSKYLIPTMYVPVKNTKTLYKLQTLRKYEVIEVVAKVNSTYANMPWIEVESIRALYPEREVLKDSTLVNIKYAIKLEEERKYSLASERLQMALNSGVPLMYEGFVRHHLGDSLMNENKAKLAYDNYIKALKVKENDASLMIAKAKAELELGMYNEAIATGAKLNTLSAQYPEIHAIMGEAYAKIGNVSKGLILCDLTIDTPGISPEKKAMGQVHKARILSKAKHYSEAVRTYALAIGETSPLTGAAWLRKEIGKFYEDRFMATGDTELLAEAVREYRNVNGITMNRDSEGLFLLANAYFQESKTKNVADYEKTKALLDKISVLDSTYIPALVLSGKIAEEEGRIEDASNIFNRIASQNPSDPSAYMALAQLHEKSGKKVDATLAYEKVVMYDKTNAVAYNKLAENYELLGKLEDAKDAYANLVRINPDEKLYHYNYGRLALITGDYDLAVSESMKGLSDDEKGIAPRINLSIALEAKDDLAGAEQQMKILLEKYPDNITAMIRRAYLLAEMGKDLDIAQKLAENAVNKAKEMVDAWDALGWVQFKQGNNNEALSTLKSIKEEERTRKVWFHLGSTEAALENYDEAIPSLKKVLAPVKADEIKAIAEKLIKRARKLIPETIGYQREAERRMEYQARLDEIMKRKEAEAVLKARQAAQERHFEEVKFIRKKEEVQREENVEREVLPQEKVEIPLPSVHGEESVKATEVIEPVGPVRNAETEKTSEKVNKKTPEIFGYTPQQDPENFKWEASAEELNSELADISNVQPELSNDIEPELYSETSVDNELTEYDLKDGPELSSLRDKVELAILWPSEITEQENNPDRMLAAMAPAEEVYDNGSCVVVKEGEEKEQKMLKSATTNNQVVVLPEWAY
jgi:tetratricopeptide (TPR) repeat protein